MLSLILIIVVVYIYLKNPLDRLNILNDTFRHHIPNSPLVHHWSRYCAALWYVFDDAHDESAMTWKYSSTNNVLLRKPVCGLSVAMAIGLLSINKTTIYIYMHPLLVYIKVISFAPHTMWRSCCSPAGLGGGECEPDKATLHVHCHCRVHIIELHRIYVILVTKSRLDRSVRALF